MYFSKEFVIALYKKLASLYSKDDIEQQGGTQFASELKYFLATDYFKKQKGKSCDVNIKNDKDFFVFSVGKIVLLSNDGSFLATKNFANSVGDAKDFDVGSNFFSANAVAVSKKTSDPQKFPNRHPQLLTIINGIIDTYSGGYENLAKDKEYLGGIVRKYALVFLWLNRFSSFNSKESIYSDSLFNLKKDFSSELVSALQWNSDEVRREVEKLLSDVQLVENKPNFEREDFIMNLELSASNNNIPHPHNLILYGPPGTGKTYRMQQDYIDRFSEENRFITTFHQSFSYEEFVEGLKPVISEKSVDTEQEANRPSDVKYTIEKGIFYKACERAAKLAGFSSLGACVTATKDDRNQKMQEAIKTGSIVLLCIDEINRANVSAVFGDLISLVEPSKRLGAEYEMTVSLPYSKKAFGVPANLMIVGTMNTADRSIQLLDSALRRRFRFEELMPDYDAIPNDSAKKILQKINARIRCLLDKDHQIGHSYFIDVKSDLEIFNALKDSVIPLLEEYFYNDAQKIRQILNENAGGENCFYIEDADAKSAMKSIQEDYDDEKEFYMLNPKLADVKTDADAKNYLSHLE